MIAPVIFCVFSLMAQSSGENNWPQFRGPDRSGISNETINTVNWNESKPELLWKRDIGSGFSEVTIAGDIIYTQDSDSIEGFEYIGAYNALTGDEIWRTKTDSIYIDVDGWGNGPRSTPTYDDNNIYSFSGSGMLCANSRKTGKLIWSHNIIDEFGSSLIRWGFSTSPMITDNQVVIEIGGGDNKLLMSFDTKTGEKKWENGSGSPSHNSPLLAEINGTKQIIHANGNTLYSFNLNGDTLWTFAMPFTSPTAMPVFIAPNKLFLSAIRTPAFFVVEVNNNKPEQVASGSSMKNDFSSCVYHDGYIYGYHVAAVRCITADSGDVAWTKRGFGKGSLMLVDDKLLILSDQGKLALVDTDPEKYTELGTIQALEGKCWTAPSFSNGRVYVRNLTQIACYKINN